MALDLCKYYKKQRYVSYNNGVTWQPLEEYDKGELYEAHSSSCGSSVFQYRWVLVDNAYICDEKDRYTKEVYQYSEDGIVWYNVFPTQYRKGTLVETNSTLCDNAGGGQYTSGETEPVGGETEPCPNGYQRVGNDCVCKGTVIDGQCVQCGYLEIWSEREHRCVCDTTIPRRQIIERDGVCITLDPYKAVKCENSDGILRRSDVMYYPDEFGNYNWVNLSYEIGDCIYRIDDSAFNGQIALTSVTIPSSVTEIGDYAFANCNNLETLNFPSDISEIGTHAFLLCGRLKNITFGGDVPSEVPTGAFSQCSSLESASWLQYNSITSINNEAFYNCYSLNNVVLPETLQTIGDSAFYANHSLESITIPSGVTSIGANSFESCSSMTFVNINSNVIEIGDEAFKNNANLTAVTINSSGLTIGNNVFNGCTKLLKLTFTATVPPEIGEDDFDNTNECSIFVPCESVDAYKAAWSQYAHRIDCNDTGVYYRWIVDGIQCVGTDEYIRERQQSTTNGISWTDTGVYAPITFITHYSKNCGYIGDVGLTVTNEDGYTRYYEPCD